MNVIMASAKAAGATVQVMNAQLYAQKFYEKHGFVAEGDHFDEAGIDHVKMACST